MGVNTDGKETGPGSTVTDGVENTEKACEFEQHRENEKSPPQDADCDVGIQEQKPAKESGLPVITSLQNLPSQHTSSALNTEHNKAQREHTYGEDRVLSNTPTLLRPDVEHKKTKLSRGTPLYLETNKSADEKSVRLDEYTSSLQPGELVEILDKISPNDISASKLELPFNPDIYQIDEEGYTQLYKAASEGHFEGVKDLISRGANPNTPSKGELFPLHAAAQEGHTHIVKLLILQGADVNEDDEKGNTPLIGAATKGHMDVIKCLIRQAADVNRADDKGRTPFNAAVQGGHLEAVKFLMAQGAKQNSYDGLTPLFAAAHLGHSDIVEYFISNGADMNETDDKGKIPLHGAAAGGHMKILKYLIPQGSDVNKKDNTGWTAFNAAVRNGHLGAVKYLMSKGAKQNRYDGMTPLYAAAHFGHLDIVKFLVSTGADVNEENENGKIPLHGAATRGHMKMMKYFIQQGSAVNKKDNTGLTAFNAVIQNDHLEAVKYLTSKGAKQNRYDGMTPLYAAAQVGHLGIVKFLVSKGADVNAENENGKIPLHDAATRGHMKVMKYFVQKGSDVNKCDAEGRTPFNAAVLYGHLEAVKYLISKGAKQNRYDGMTPLCAAAHFGHLDIVRFLVSTGADVNEENDEGKIPLHGAALKGNVEVLKYLIQQGSDVNKGDVKGSTPFNIAIQYGNLEAVKYLITKEARQNRNSCMAPLYASAQVGHLNNVKLFISDGADVNEKDDQGRIPLHGAASEGHMQVMKYLIQQGSDVNKKDNTGRTPFNAVVQEGHLGAIKYLISKGAKQNRYDGMTPLYVAARLGHLDIVKFFISEGADVNKGNDNGRIPLHGAAAGGQMKVMEYLIQQGSDLNKKDNTGWTPFNAAVSNGHLEVGKVLLAERAQGTGFQGLTQLYIATQYDHVDVEKFLVSSGYDVNERNDCGKSPLHAACYNGNMDIVKFLVHHNANVNEQDHDGWTPLHAGSQEGHQYIVDNLALNGADMHVSDVDVDSLTPLQAAANTTNPPSRGDPDEEETGDPRSGGHQNIITRGYVTVTIKNEQTQLAYQVDNADEGYDCIQADILERGDDELSLKSLPTRTHDDEKADKEERNPLIQGKLRYHDEGDEDPMLHHKEAIKCIGIRGRDTITNSTYCSSPHAPLTWQYSGCDPSYLNTMETDAHPSVEPESRCHSLIDENREIRESSSTVNDGNDLSINETSLKRKSFPTHPLAVVHQKLYDGNPVSSQGTSSNPVWKIGIQRRTSVGRMIIALAIILAGSPILVAGIDSTDRVTLQAGQPGVVPFHFQWPPSDTSQVVPYYTVRFESNPLPFCINGKVDIKGFKNPSQIRRFSTSVSDLDTSPCVNLIIDNVDTLDEDRYLLTVVWHSFENVRYETIRKRVDVQTPPGRAKCFITLSENGDYAYEVHCETTTRSVTNTLSCFQNDRQIDVKGDITDNGLITRGIFLLPDNTYFSCCAHDITSHVSETMCNDFEWLNGKETKRQIVNTVPKSVTNPTPQEESHTGSGACRQFILPSMWHFTYILVNLLAFVTMY